MATDRRAIQSYFAKAEENAVQQYANKHRLTLSKAVEALVKKGLSGGSETPEAVVLDKFYDQKIDVLEGKVEGMTETCKCFAAKNEKLEYQVCCLQEDLERTRGQLEAKRTQFFSDDEIAAMTGKRVQNAWEWRHGLRKPRGHRVLKALEGISVIEGRWCKPC